MKGLSPQGAACRWALASVGISLGMGPGDAYEAADAIITPRGNMVPDEENVVEMYEIMVQISRRST